tara:strand:- start:262 stop:555 length:294 start_codon:yes stop_codon:yes gene_type:complete
MNLQIIKELIVEKLESARDDVIAEREVKLTAKSLVSGLTAAKNLVESENKANADLNESTEEYFTLINESQEEKEFLSEEHIKNIANSARARKLSGIK